MYRYRCNEEGDTPNRGGGLGGGLWQDHFSDASSSISHPIPLHDTFGRWEEVVQPHRESPLTSPTVSRREHALTISMTTWGCQISSQDSIYYLGCLSGGVWQKTCDDLANPAIHLFSSNTCMLIDK